MDNLVHKKHMPFNNLPLGEQKTAEIKLKAAKNTPLKSLWGTTEIGSGAAELGFLFCKKAKSKGDGGHE